MRLSLRIRIWMRWPQATRRVLSTRLMAYRFCSPPEIVCKKLKCEVVRDGRPPATGSRVDDRAVARDVLQHAEKGNVALTSSAASRAVSPHCTCLRASPSRPVRMEPSRTSETCSRGSSSRWPSRSCRVLADGGALQQLQVTVHDCARDPGGGGRGTGVVRAHVRTAQPVLNDRSGVARRARDQERIFSWSTSPTSCARRVSIGSTRFG
jgi:hypothetical protein